MPIVSSDIFRITPATYTFVVMVRWIRMRWSLVFALPFASIITGFILDDYKYVMLSLVLVCMLLPPIQILVYYFSATDPRAYINVLRHSVACDGIDIILTSYADLPHEDDETEYDDDEPITENEGNPTDTTSNDNQDPPTQEEQPVETNVIPISKVHGVHFAKSNLILTLARNRLAPVLIIPYSAFPTIPDLRTFVSLIR